MRPAFAILISQRGVYRTEPDGRMDVCGAYGNVFCGQPRARCLSATSLRDLTVRAIDEGPPQCVTHAASKFLGTCATIEPTRRQIRSLVGFGGFSMPLCKVA